ncbi:hypothetical protein, partial [Croceicoccus ponticola]|uniref:hypothetical protein n=1 Tax=Croceicoccus ponticola TaxID=2217664 RepID=UPI00196A68C7
CCPSVLATVPKLAVKASFPPVKRHIWTPYESVNSLLQFYCTTALRTSKNTEIQRDGPISTWSGARLPG